MIGSPVPSHLRRRRFRTSFGWLWAGQYNRGGGVQRRQDQPLDRRTSLGVCGTSGSGLYYPLRLLTDDVMVDSRHSGEMSSQRRTVSDGHDSIEQSNEQSLSFSLRHPFISV